MIKTAPVTIESMAFRGFGIARIDGKVVFVPYSVTKDKAWVQLIEEKKDYAIGKLSQLIEPSPWRVLPPCPCFGQCGGCHWQHIDEAIQREFKKEILIQALKRFGKLEQIPPISVVPSPDSFGYRTRVQLRVKEKTLGYYQEKSHRLIDIDHCPVSHPLVNQIMVLLRKELPTVSGIQEIEINISAEEEKGVVIFHLLSFRPGLERFLKKLLQAYPILKGLMVIKKRESTFSGDPHLNFVVSFHGHRGIRSLELRTSPQSFSQVNSKQNLRLIDTVADFSEGKKDQRILDLYAGIGNLTLPLAIEAEEVIGIEENRMAVEDARWNVEKNSITNCRFILGRVEEVLTHWKWKSPDLIVLDPPRAGCKRALGQVVRLKPKKVIYVSCEPTTFSRDLRFLSENGYVLQKLTLIDMFPQTYHMEMVGLLTQSQVKG